MFQHRTSKSTHEAPHTMSCHPESLEKCNYFRLRSLFVANVFRLNHLPLSPFCRKMSFFLLLSFPLSVPTWNIIEYTSWTHCLTPQSPQSAAPYFSSFWWSCCNWKRLRYIHGNEWTTHLCIYVCTYNSIYIYSVCKMLWICIGEVDWKIWEVYGNLTLSVNGMGTSL